LVVDLVVGVELHLSRSVNETLPHVIRVPMGIRCDHEDLPCEFDLTGVEVPEIEVQCLLVESAHVAANRLQQGPCGSRSRDAARGSLQR
jgi:hypothetical protein